MPTLKVLDRNSLELIGAGNYRPVSLTSVVGKLLEHSEDIHDRIDQGMYLAVSHTSD